MKEIKLKGGLNVPLFGSVEKFKVEDLEPKFIGILSEDYFGLKPKFLASEGDQVRVGQPIIEDKTNHGFKIVSPVSGVISSVNRGEKRALISVEIENDKKNTLFELNISGDIGEDLNSAGLWDSLRERPFDRVPNINSKPNYIFVNGFQKIENITEDELWYTANNTKKVLGIDPSLLTSGGTHLGRYFYKQEDYLDSGKMGKYVIMNRAKPTNNAQFIEENKTLWKPYFKKTMGKNGSTGWGIASRIAPYYEDSSTILTWDVFDSMTNVMKYLAGENPLPASIANKTKMGELMPKGFKAIEIWEIIGSTN